MSERHPMTEPGYRKLLEELKELKKVERPKASKAIEIAREHGDLKENAEYHAAKEHQGMLESRITHLEVVTSLAEVIDISKLSGEKVMFGATVLIEDVDTGDSKTVIIVGEEEADVNKGHISYKSPVARALIGRNLDDIAKVNLPGGAKEYEIREVSFKGVS